MKVVFGGQIARAAVLEALRRFDGIELVEVAEPEDACPHLAGADVLVIANPRGGQGRKVAEALCSDRSTVRWVQVVSAGTDGLTSHPLPAGLPVSNQGGAAAPAVAEHALALLLALVRQLGTACQLQGRGEWKPEALRPALQAVEGMQVGVVGLGNIGQSTARRLRAFDARVHGFSRSGAAMENVDQAHALATLPDVVPTLDAVVICLALVPQTRHLFDDAMLGRCKKGAFLVNVSRGEIVDTTALEAALREGRLAGAGLDVTDPEPLPAGHPLWSAPNVLVTPHTAPVGNKLVGRRVAAAVAENLRRFLDGRPLQNLVEY